MPDPVDPTSLEGDELDRWYRRSPQELEQERQAAADRRYTAFFGAPQTAASESGGAPSAIPRSKGISGDDSNVLWIANGTGGYRAIRPGIPDYQAALTPSPARPGSLPEHSAAPEDADFVEVGNPHNRRLRREWEVANGQPWPKTEDGRSYHVAHKRAIADGGANTLDNIEPMHPDEHIAQHANNGDNARWGRRSWIARAFGGRVEPPTPRARVNGLGLLGVIPDITGILSGRIRTDTPTHFLHDMAGIPAPDDKGQDIDPLCRAMGITKPGWKCA